MLKHVTLCAVVSIASSSLARPGGFYGGYCSARTEDGHWAISFGEQDERMHCILVQHRLGPTHSEVAEVVSGEYDRYDMNRVDVTCLDEAHSFGLDDFGDYGLERALRKARRSDATHCIFRVTPHFPK